MPSSLSESSVQSLVFSDRLQQTLQRLLLVVSVVSVVVGETGRADVGVALGGEAARGYLPRRGLQGGAERRVASDWDSGFASRAVSVPRGSVSVSRLLVCSFVDQRVNWYWVRQCARQSCWFLISVFNARSTATKVGWLVNQSDR